MPVQNKKNKKNNHSELKIRNKRPVPPLPKGISYFKNLEELNNKESRRLDLGSKILKMIGVKTKLIGNHGIKIWGQPNLKLNKNYILKNYLKDHRVMAMGTIAALTLGGKWKIYDPDSIKTSFPSFFKIINKDLGAKISL